MSSYIVNPKPDLPPKPYSWSADVDDDGYRNYTVKWKIKSAKADCPYTIMRTPGLPAVGSFWNFGSEPDIWSFCWPTMRVTPTLGDEEPYIYWLVEQLFTNRPRSSCANTPIENPLLEPVKKSGSFIKYTKEAYKDRFGRFIRNTSHEQFRGQSVEFDANRPAVVIEMNVALLGLDTFASMIDTVNDAPLWGLPARCIKLSNAPWESKTYGTCIEYYTRRFEFDIMWETFDRSLPNIGQKVLRGHWDNSDPPDYREDPSANPDNPKHFIQAKDSNDENITTFLDAIGRPLDLSELGTGSLAAPEGFEYNEEGYLERRVEYYPESNFLTLGIPLTL